MMSISKQHSDFMAIARFIMIYGLVVHHIFTIPNTGSFPRNGMEGYVFLIPEAINAFFHMWFMAAVPMLSIISGYLFFEGNHVGYSHVVRKKIITTALPSWLWCALWLLFAYLLYVVGHERGFFEWANYHFDDFSLLHLANGVIGITDYPFAFQFWFVHDLLLTFLLYPFIRYGLLKLGVFFPIVCFLIWGSAIDIPVFFSPNVFFFFVVGAYLGHTKALTIETFILSRGWGVLVVLLFLLILMCRAWTSLLFNEGVLFDLVRSQYFLLLLRVMGVLASFQLISWFMLSSPSVCAYLKRLSRYSFLIFAMHYPIVELVKIAVERIPYQSSSMGVFLSWLLIPVITTVLCILGARVLSMISPTLLSLLNGKRSIE